MFFLALCGVFIAGMLVLYDWKIILLPCSTGGCGRVADWPPSKIVSAVGILFYLLIALLCWRRAGQPEADWRPLSVFIAFLTTLGALASWALLYYADAVLKATCDWCIASAVTMTSIWLLSAFQVSNRRYIEQAPAPLGDRRLFVGFMAMFVVFGSGYAWLQYSNLVRVREEASAKYSLILPTDVPLHSRGPISAPITIVEFADFTCASCRQAFFAMEQLHRDNPNSVRLVFRHFPLIDKQGPLPGHEQSLPAAVTAELAEKLQTGAFWKVTGALYRKQEAIKPAAIQASHLEEIVRDTGLDLERFRSLDDTEALAAIERDRADGGKAGVTSTPTFYVLTPDKRIRSVQNAKGLENALNQPGIRKLLEKPFVLPPMPADKSAASPGH